MSNNNIPDLPQQTGFTLISSKKKKKSPISQGLESGAKRISFQDNNSPEGETQGTTETPVKAPDPQIANQQNSNSLDQVQIAFIGTSTNCYNLFEDNDDESVDGNEYQDLKDPNEYEDQAINEIQTKMMNMEDRINENISKAMDRMEQLVINAIVNNQQQQHHYNQYAYSYHQQQFNYNVSQAASLQGQNLQNQAIPEHQIQGISDEKKKSSVVNLNNDFENCVQHSNDFSVTNDDSDISYDTHSNSGNPNIQQPVQSTSVQSSTRSNQSHQTYSTVARGNVTVQITNNSQTNSTQDTTSNPSTTSTNTELVPSQTLLRSSTTSSTITPSS